MKKATVLFCIAIVLTSWSNYLLAQDQFQVKADMGIMTPFYRNQPILTEWIYQTPDNIKMPVPAFMLDKKIAFPYKKRSTDGEVLFCDDVNIVRFLGGWSATKSGGNIAEAAKVDLAYRDENGKIQYRWNLIPARIDPVFKMGYTNLTIVLDNIPWCFPVDASEPDNEKAAANKQPKGYGQNKQPAHMEEWTDFISELCKQLIKLYGYETVNKWGFRLGTEMNGKVRWDGTSEEYTNFYITTAKVVHNLLPNARFGPYNRAGADYEQLVDLAAKAKAEKVPFDWVAVSFYSVLKQGKGKVNYDALNPDVAVQKQMTPTWDAVSKASAKGESLSREIHEYGWFLVNEFGNNDNAPGARGLAGNFYNMFTLREAGLNKLYHWNLKDPVWENNTPMLSSLAWLFSILDYTVGAQNVELNYKLDVEPQSTQKYKSIGFFHKSGRSYIITACYNMDRNESKENVISVFVPKKYLLKSNYKLSATWYGNENDPYMILRNDLAENNLLAPDLQDKPNVIQTVNQMSPGRKGYKYVADNYSKYEDLMRENLILKKYKGEVKYTSDGAVFKFTISSPMTFVIALD